MARPTTRFGRTAVSAARTADARGRTADSYQNFISKVGLGTGNQGDGGSYGFNPITRNRNQLDWMYRGSWLIGQVVDTVADDMTREGIDVTATLKPDQVDALYRALETRACWPAVNDAIKWGRLYGGGLGVYLIDGQAPETPLRLETVGRDAFRGLLVLDRWMVQPSLSDLCVELGPALGMPNYYDVTQTGPGVPAMRVHRSRVMRFDGVPLPYYQRLSENLWSMSVVERLYDRLLAFDSATQGAAQLVYKAHLRTLKIEGFRDIVANGGTALDGVLKMVQMMRLMQSNEGITVLDSTDEFKTDQYAFSGLADIILQMGEQVSGATGIPLVRLFGQSPAGLNSTGAADIRQYYDNVKQRQERQLRQPIDKLLRVTAASEGIKLPPDFGFKFVPLWQLSAQEKTEVAAKTTETVLSVSDKGLITDRTALMELRQQSRETGVFGTITDEDIEAADDELPDPSELPGAMAGQGGPGAPPGTPPDTPPAAEERGDGDGA